MLKRFFLILFMLMLAAAPAAQAADTGTLLFADGEKSLILSEADLARYAALAAQISENAPADVLSAQLTLEQRAQMTGQLSEAERAVATLWGLPGEGDISQEQALLTAYGVLEKELHLSEEELAALFPVFTFEVTDPAAPLWSVKWIPMGSGEMHYTVKLYAGSGCIAQIRMSVAVG